MIENQKQQRARLEDQRQFGVGSSMVIIPSTKKIEIIVRILVRSFKSNAT
jgi:hypothetical protein